MSVSMGQLELSFLIAFWVLVFSGLMFSMMRWLVAPSILGLWSAGHRLERLLFGRTIADNLESLSAREELHLVSSPAPLLLRTMNASDQRLIHRGVRAALPYCIYLFASAASLADGGWQSLYWSLPICALSAVMLVRLVRTRLEGAFDLLRLWEVSTYYSRRVQVSDHALSERQFKHSSSRVVLHAAVTALWLALPVVMTACLIYPHAALVTLAAIPVVGLAAPGGRIRAWIRLQRRRVDQQLAELFTGPVEFSDSAP
ncbi:hypothetical protein HZA57_00715 [Candidatus Poribacteria bacterium]|nr:hypothetical protein [Candidatus Poribacteria bacterium]